MGGGKRRVETARAGRDPEDNMIINQIMLRFRPIAPRPATVESPVGYAPVKEKRAKRKYVRVKKIQKKKKKKKKMVEECNLSLNRTVAMAEVSNGGELVTDPVRRVPDQWISFNVAGKNCYDNVNDIIGRWITPDRAAVGLHDVDLTVTVTREKLVESWITVESVIGTCQDDEMYVRYTDEEIWKDLESDSCPGFVSNGCDEVQWVNLAYRRMVDPEPDGGGPPCQVVVWLGVKVEKSAFMYWQAFSCRVRVVYVLLEKEKEKKKQMMTVPCDVWKMDSGGYAWRLDVKAALSLGRVN